MADMGFARHLVALIAYTVVDSLYEDQQTNIRVSLGLHGETSGWFEAMPGVKQGCILSPYLFNLMAELLMRHTLDGYEPYDGEFKIGAGA